MRPIKFRGRSMLDGEWLFGDLIHGFANSFAIRTEDDGIHCVIPDTIAQLVGHDQNGNEVYEYDQLVDKDGSKLHALIFNTVLFKGDPTRPTPCHLFILDKEEADETD